MKFKRSASSQTSLKFAKKSTKITFLQFKWNSQLVLRLLTWWNEWVFPAWKLSTRKSQHKFSSRSGSKSKIQATPRHKLLCCLHVVDVHAVKQRSRDRPPYPLKFWFIALLLVHSEKEVGRMRETNVVYDVADLEKSLVHDVGSERRRRRRNVFWKLQNERKWAHPQNEWGIFHDVFSHYLVSLSLAS